MADFNSMWLNLSPLLCRCLCWRVFYRPRNVIGCGMLLRCGVEVSCTCTQVDATQLMFLALAHMSMLRN